MVHEPILIEISGKIATVTLNRPEKKNALNRAMRDRLREFISNETSELHAVIITGAGDGFCSGMDMTEKMGSHESREQWSLFRSIFNCKTVFIAAVNGPARGAGISFVNACDLAVADPTANFGLPAINYGFYSSVAATTSQIVLPKKVVAKMLFTGLPISAEEAADAKLVNHVSAPGNSLNEARKIAERLAGLDRYTLGGIKEGLNTIPYTDGDRNQNEQLTVAINFTNRPSDTTAYTLGADKIRRD